MKADVLGGGVVFQEHISWHACVCAGSFMGTIWQECVCVYVPMYLASCRHMHASVYACVSRLSLRQQMMYSSAGRLLSSH